MNSIKKQKIASIALTISFLGTGATYFSGGFLGSLLHHGFLASLIGGLADWFAVVALFRKPLGISYRSEILKRNKQRIMDEIVDFVAHDILSPENIMRVLKKENMSELLIVYLRERGGKNRITAVAREVLSAWLQSIDTETLSKNLAPAIKDELFVALKKENIEKILDLFVKNDKQTLTVLANIGEEILNLESVQKELKSKIKEAIESYVKDSMGRSMLVGFLNLDEDTVFEKIQEAFLAKTNGIKSGEGESFEAAKLKLQNYIESVKNSSDFEEKITQIKEYTKDKFFIENAINEIVKTQINDKNLKAPLENFLLSKLEEFEKNKDLQLQFDNWVKNFITESIEKNHELIERLVRERLDEFSEDEFSDFVEEKVNDDLQMIRVNGAIVGGLAGMVLYIIIYAMERASGL